MPKKSIIRLTLSRLPSEIQRRYGTIHVADCVMVDGAPVEIRVQVYPDDTRIDVWRVSAGVWSPVRKTRA